jgi:hypothetical protein
MLFGLDTLKLVTLRAARALPTKFNLVALLAPGLGVGETDHRDLQSAVTTAGRMAATQSVIPPHGAST